MRTFFVLGSKLLGVLFLYWSIIGLAGTIMTIQHIETMGVSILITGIISTVITLGFSLLLLFQSEAIAEDFKLPTYEVEAKDFQSEKVLRVGIILIGLYAFISDIGLFLKMVSKYLMGVSDSIMINAPHWLGNAVDSKYALIDIVVVAGVIVLSLFMIFGSNYLIWLIQKLEVKQPNHCIQADAAEPRR